MNTTAGCGQAGANSVELASLRPSTLRANSITAICVVGRKRERKEGEVREEFKKNGHGKRYTPWWPNKPPSRSVGRC